MPNRKQRSIRQLLIAYISAVMVLLPAYRSWAMFLPSHETATLSLPEVASDDLAWAKIQASLELKIVRQRLLDLGLKPETVARRLAQLPEAERHQIASQIDSLYAGGDGLGFLVSLVFIAVLVVLLLHITGHKVIITK